jgi:hypothetical protein
VVSLRLEQDVGRTARQIEHMIRRRDIREPDQATLPSAVLSVRQEAGNEVVAVGDRRKEIANVTLFAFGRGNRAAQSGAAVSPVRDERRRGAARRIRGH